MPRLAVSPSGGREAIRVPAYTLPSPARDATVSQEALDSTRPYRINRGSDIPLYRQIEEDLRERIEDGLFTPGMRLPSEAELSELYDASRITIRQALRDLASGGLVSRQPGRGTYVRDIPVEVPTRQITSLVWEMRQLGFEVDTKVLVHDTVIADEDVPARLGIPSEGWVHRVKRLRLADGAPFAYLESRLPADRFPGFEHVDLSGSLYAQLREVYGVVPAEAEETISVGEMAREAPDARRAMGEGHSSVLVVERLTFDDDGPIEWGRSLIDSSRYQIRFAVTNKTRH